MVPTRTLTREEDPPPALPVREGAVTCAEREEGEDPPPALPVREGAVTCAEREEGEDPPPALPVREGAVTCAIVRAIVNISLDFVLIG